MRILLPTTTVKPRSFFPPAVQAEFFFHLGPMLGEFARIKWCRADRLDHFSSIEQAPFVWPLDGTTKRGHTMTQNYQTRFAAFRYCITPLATIALAISGAAAELLTVDDEPTYREYL